jgi:hypothetical protein
LKVRKVEFWSKSAIDEISRRCIVGFGLSMLGFFMPGIASCIGTLS